MFVYVEKNLLIITAFNTDIACVHAYDLYQKIEFNYFTWCNE